MKTIVAALLFAVSLQAIAQETGFYITGSFGRSQTEIDTAGISADLTSIGISHSGISTDETDTGWKASVGYRFNRNFAVEGGLMDMGEFSAKTSATALFGTPVGPNSITLNVKVKDVFHLSGLAIFPADRFYAFGRLGLYRADVESRTTVSGVGGTRTFTASDTSTGLMFGAGVGFDLTKTIGIRAEWENLVDVGDKETTGEGDVGFFSVGLVVRF